MPPDLTANADAASRPRLRRWVCSPVLHGAYVVLGTAVLWGGWFVEPYLWAFTVLGLSLLAPVILLIAGFAIHLDRRDGQRRRAHALLLWLHGVFLVQLGGHWIVLLGTPFGC